MPKKATPITCDWKTGAISRREKKPGRSRLCKYKGNFKWQGIKIEKYKTDRGNWADIARQTLIGNYGETTKFHLRYFEIEPDGYSSLEKHRHEHVVICTRGKGNVLLGKKTCEINLLDVLYIAPNTPHQLTNPFNKPFGFFCIVNAKRDKPKILNH